MEGCRGCEGDTKSLDHGSCSVESKVSSGCIPNMRGRMILGTPKRDQNFDNLQYHVLPNLWYPGFRV